MLLVSACLAGKKCRYDGNDNAVPSIVRMAEAGEALPVCPEDLGGLPTPREPVELREGRAMTPSGKDVTEAFRRGAEEGVRLALASGCTQAILKSRSPSCGCGVVYDGTFTHTRVPGNGVFAQALMGAGVSVRTEED